jgi:hypothetical protein
MSNSKHKEYIERLKGLFGNTSEMTPENIQGFVGETMQQLSSLRESLESNDPKVREEGMRSAQELKEILESQMEGMAKLMGNDPAALESFMNPSPMDIQDQEILSNAKEQFKHLKSSFSSQNENKKVNQKVSIIG